MCGIVIIFWFRFGFEKTGILFGMRFVLFSLKKKFDLVQIL